MKFTFIIKIQAEESERNSNREILSIGAHKQDPRRSMLRQDASKERLQQR